MESRKLEAANLEHIEPATDLATPPPPPSAPLSTSRALGQVWQEWLQFNLERGCTAQSLLDQMIADQIEPERARYNLAQAQHRLASQNDPGWTPCSQPFLPSRLAAGNMVDLGDRQARLLMRLQRPDIAWYDDVLSNEECDELIEFARPGIMRSLVNDDNTGENMVSDVRTSDSRTIRRGSTPLIARIEQRLAILANWPLEHGEELQVINYQPGKQYIAHHDFLRHTYLAKQDPALQGGQRVATLLVYLNDVPAGGATHFPHVGLTITPRKGSVLYFAYTGLGGDVDLLALHAGLPVEDGEKWIATKWLRQGPHTPGRAKKRKPAPADPV